MNFCIPDFCKSPNPLESLIIVVIAKESNFCFSDFDKGTEMVDARGASAKEYCWKPCIWSKWRLRLDVP